MKKFLAVLMIGAISLCLFGCNAEEDAEAALDTMMTAFKSGDREQILSYYDFEAESNIIDAEESRALEEVILSTLSKMDYKIKGAEKLDSSQVRFDIELTTVDFSKIMELYITQVMTMVASPEYQAKVNTMTQEEYQQMLAEQMKEVIASPEVSTAVNEVTLTMVKENGVWTAGPEKEEFINSVFNNLWDAVNSLV